MAPRPLFLALAAALFSLLAASSASAAPTPGIATEFGGAADKQSRDSASLGLLDGACGFGNMSRGDFPAWKAAALPPNSVLLGSGESSNKLGCGICVKVTCDPSRQLPFSPCKAGSLPVTVMVVVSWWKGFFFYLSPLDLSSTSLQEEKNSNSPFLFPPRSLSFLSHPPKSQDSCPTCDKNQINIHVSAFQDFLGPIPKVAVTLERVACEPKSNLVLKVTEARTSSGGFIRVAPQVSLVLFCFVSCCC